jgi:energy-coupling factor transporter ATP-binding protein EcfA2
MLDTTRLRTDLSDIESHLQTVAANSNGDLTGRLRKITRPDAPGTALIWQALHADCLRIAYTAVSADGEVTDAEIEELYEYLYTVAKIYSKVVDGYHEFGGLDLQEARAFLHRYDQDRGPFGYQCASAARWIGLDLCRGAAQLGLGSALELYERMAARLTEEALAVGKVAPDDPRWRARLTQIDDLRASLATKAPVNGTAIDLRVRAFLEGRRVFSSVAQAASVFEDDPWDVEAVDADAREAFDLLIDHAQSPGENHDRGRMLLLLGDSGAGKTHLLRAFRRRVHDARSGFAAYAQLQSQSHDYGRYLLSHVVDSLDRAYSGPSPERTGLLELATGLSLVAPAVASRIESLGQTEADGEELAREVNDLVDELVRVDELRSFDPDLLRAFLYLLRRDSAITTRVVKYLRCEDLNRHDRGKIGDVVPRIDADDPLRMIRSLAKLAFKTRRAALVLMVDQAELAGFTADTSSSFRRAVDALHQVVSEVPSAVAIIACLEDLWTKVAPELTRSARDRLEKDPPVERLAINRSYAEIEAIVARRLTWLYDEAGVATRTGDGIHPIPERGLRNLTNRRTRDILERCHRFQEACSEAGRIVEDWDGWPGGVTISNEAERTADLDQVAAEWNDHLHSRAHEIPTDEDEIMTALDDAAKACASENEAVKASVKRVDRAVLVDLSTPIGKCALALGVANRSYHRGAFAAQVDAVAKTAGKSRAAVIVRTSDFPGGAGSAAKIASLLKAGGRKAQLAPSDLRAVAAMRTFTSKQPADVLIRWRRRDRPISGQSAIAALFDLHTIIGEAPVARVAPPRAQAAPDPETARDTERNPTLTSDESRPWPSSAGSAPSTDPPPTGTLHVGSTVAFRPEPVRLEREIILRHAGVLGSTGSGKTTLALNLLEQLLEQDVAVVLVDRKGDLAGYAAPEWWSGIADPVRRKRAQALAVRTDVRLFTPGTRGGRPLAFGVIPGLDGVPEYDRGRVVQHAASALAAMMRLGDGSQDAARRAILAQAIAVLAERSAPASLEDLLSLLESRDDELVARTGRYEDRLFKKLETDLETLRLNDGDLFDGRAEQLSAEVLLARAAGGRTPLSIVSTKFLGDNIRIQAWVAHLLVELGRWCVRSPRPTLQAVIMLDEADLYMPAGASKPPSKEPLQDLLKRARSGGLGVILSTQSPGDLDYRSREQINTWFVGRVAEQRSVDKLKPLFERKPAAAGKLGDLHPGHFLLLQDAKVAEIERVPSLLVTEQVPDTQILELASAARVRTGQAGAAKG